MKTRPLIILLVMVIACDSDFKQEHNDLLTSIIWTNQALPVNGDKPEAAQIFNKNGEYTLEFGDVMKVTGQWKWISEDEIHVTHEAIILKGEKRIERKATYNVRILEISETSLKTLKKFETDTWDSAFVTLGHYRPVR